METSLVVQITPEELTTIIRDAVRIELSTWTPPNADLKNEMPEFLTRHEVAKLLRISLVTLHEWDKAGTIPKKITVNGRVRYRRDEILAVLDRTKQLKHRAKAKVAPLWNKEDQKPN